MKLGLGLLALVAFGSPAFAARDALVIFENATKNSAGIADYVDSSFVDGSKLTIVTRSGDVIPVRFFSKLDAVILKAYLESGFAVDVSACSKLDKIVASSVKYDGECVSRTYTLRFSCGRIFGTAEAIEPGKYDPKNYNIRDTVKQPLERETTRCYAHGNKI